MSLTRGIITIDRPISEADIARLRLVWRDWLNTPGEPLVLGKGARLEFVQLRAAPYWRCAWCGNTWAAALTRCPACNGPREDLEL